MRREERSGWKVHLNVIHFQVSYFYDRAQFTSRVGNQQGVSRTEAAEAAGSARNETISFYCV